MLSGLLEKYQCAECRFCCVFDKEDFWEMPSLLKPTANEILRLKPNTILCKNGEVYQFSSDNFVGELYPCPALTDKGCALPSNLKPFECSIWAFRVMNFNNNLVLAVCTDCKGLENIPNSIIDNFANSKIRSVAFEYAKNYPEIVKPYRSNYRIIHE